MRVTTPSTWNSAENDTLSDTDDSMVSGTQRGLELLGSDPRVDATALQTVGAKGWDGIAIATVL